MNTSITVDVLKTTDALIMIAKNSLNSKRMMLAFTTDESSIALLNSSIAIDENKISIYEQFLKSHRDTNELLKSLTSGQKATVAEAPAPVEAPKAPKRKLSPAQQQWLDEVSAVMKELPELSIEEARREASRRREEGYSEEEDDDLDDELDDDELDDEEYVEEKRPQSFLQKQWNKEVAAVMQEYPEWSVKEASKEASARRNGFSNVPAAKSSPNWVDIVTGHVASN